MYHLPNYQERDQQVVMDFIHQHPFAFLTGCDAAQKPVATQVPVFIEKREGKYYLSGHIMKHTDHHKAFLQNEHVLAVFTGPHTYVSASWYSEPGTASTWNYMSVHVHGRIRFLDEAALHDILHKITNHFENDPRSSANFENLSPAYVSRLMQAITAFEIEVLSIENVFKLSQNRDEKSYHNIIHQLEKQDAGAQQVAAEMKSRSSQLFKDQK